MKTKLFGILSITFSLLTGNNSQEDGLLNDSLSNIQNQKPYIDNFFKKHYSVIKEGESISLDYFTGTDTANVRCFRGDIINSQEDTTQPIVYTRVIRSFAVSALPVKFTSETLYFVQEKAKILDSTFEWINTSGSSFFIYRGKIIEIKNGGLVVVNGEGFGSEVECWCSSYVVGKNLLYVYSKEYIPSAPPDTRSYVYFSFDSSGQLTWFKDSTHISEYATLEKTDKTLMFSDSYGCLYLDVPIKFDFKRYEIAFNVTKPVFTISGGVFSFYEGTIKVYSNPDVKAKFKNIQVTSDVEFEVLRIFNDEYLHGFDQNRIWYFIRFNNKTGWVKYSPEISSIMGCS